MNPDPAARRLNPLYRLLLAVAAADIVFGVFTRVLLWAQFAIASKVTAGQLLFALGAGLVNDLAQMPYLLLPMALWLALFRPDWSRRRARGFQFAGLALLLFGLLFLIGLEYFFFEEFDSRFNLVAVDYLIYPTEVAGTINEGYPVGLVSAGFAAIALMILAPLWPRLRGNAGEIVPRRATFKAAGALAALCIALAFAGGSQAGQRVSNRVAAELAANGVARFYEALRTNHLEYPQFYRTGDSATLNALLRQDLGRGGGEFVPARAAGLARRFAAREDGLGKRNVVVLSEESFGAEFSGTYGDTRGLTPEFDALAPQGLLFTRAYATGTRTVRGLEAITASFPPIPSESVLKRPGGEHMATWGLVMRQLGYETSFLYGGYGTFDNMNAWYRGNGFDISDRTDIEQPKFANIWGVSDEDLFNHAIGFFDARAKEGKPFFSVVMSTSNHKPYTFPAGIPGVKPEGGGRDTGIRYADYAIGQFFRAARSHDWFNNTVFVVVADHGARVYGSAQIPLYSYEIPMLIVAPGVAPKHVDLPVSQLDIAPTVLGMLGVPYEAPFFGQDALHWDAAAGPRTLLFNHNHTVAAFRDGHLAILDLNRRVSCQHYERAPGQAARNKTDRFTPETCDAGLVDLATAYFQIGYELFSSQSWQ